MTSFTELLTASDDELVRIFYKTNAGEEKDFIKRINIVAAQLELNHSQLVCALGFNKHIRELTDIQQQLGFRSYKTTGPIGKTNYSLLILIPNYRLIIFWISTLKDLKTKKSLKPCESYYDQDLSI